MNINIRGAQLAKRELALYALTTYSSFPKTNKLWSSIIRVIVKLILCRTIVQPITKLHLSVSDHKNITET